MQTNKSVSELLTHPVVCTIATAGPCTSFSINLASFHKISVKYVILKKKMASIPRPDGPLDFPSPDGGGVGVLRTPF